MTSLGTHADASTGATTATGPAPLEFHCLCTPRFRPENYVDLGDPPLHP